MSMRKVKRTIGLILTVCLLLASAGCGQEQERKGTMANDRELKLSEDSGISMEDQLKLIVRFSDLWLKKEHKKKPYLTYAVTDLDRNGRWEIIASADRQGSGRFSYTDYFQVNEAGDGLEKIRTGYKEGESEVDLVHDLETAYYDPEKKEYHYMTGDFSTAGAAAGYVKTVEALTLSNGAIRTDCLGYENCERDRKGRETTTYYRMESGEEKKVEKMEFSRDLLGDGAYPGCGKMNTHIGWFQWEGNLQNVTEEYLLYNLRRSAEAFALADPLVQQKKEIHGFVCEVPQYNSMSDTAKQKRLNDQIVREAGKSLEQLEQDTFKLASFDCTIKENTSDRLSLLVEVSGMGTDAAHPVAWADTVNLDCRNETVLAQTDLLPEEDREWVEADILEGDCVDIRDIGYRAYRMEKGEETLLDEASEWADVNVYQTQGGIGVVIPSIYALGSYQIYEIQKDDTPLGVDWGQVDWQAYKYKLYDSDYETLQTYMPVIKGEKRFIWNKQSTREAESTSSVEVTMPQYLQEMSKEAALENITFSLDHIMVCDVTQDGGKELILSFDTLGYFHLILHKEGDRFYGIYQHARWFEDLRQNGIYHDHRGAGTASYYQMRFADGLFQETCLGGHEMNGEKIQYFIGKKDVKEKEFETWKKETLGKEVPVYEPFAKEL